MADKEVHAIKLRVTPLGNHSPTSILIFLVSSMLVAAGCSTRPYQPEPLKSVSFVLRAETQTIDALTVSAAVPGPHETQAVFDLPLYEHGIQPVWLEIGNQGDEQVRFAPVSVDRDYFSPMEVSFKLRKGFSATARKEMDQSFQELAIRRTVDPGETISGFVFTHLSPGTKSFNVDLFGGKVQQNFAFFIDVPGFVPDHAEVDFRALYSADEVHDLDTDGLRTAFGQIPCCTTDAGGQPDGLPLNIVLIGNGPDVLRALLRSRWHESQAATNGSGEPENLLFGRKADAVFYLQRKDSKVRNELSVWLAPMLLDGKTVWIGRVITLAGQKSRSTRSAPAPLPDPDVDEARAFLMENIWYSQGLQHYAWINAHFAVPFDQPRTDLNGNLYFTDGFRAVLWLSGIPISLLKASFIDLDGTPLE